MGTFFYFFKKKYENRPIKGVNIFLINKNPLFLNKRMIKYILKKRTGIKNNIGKKYLLNKVKNLFFNYPFIEKQKSKIFITANGFLKINILEKKPLIKIINGKRKYYITNKFEEIPYIIKINPSYHIMLARGIRSKIEKKNLIKIVNFILSDKVLKKNTVEIRKIKEALILLIPKKGHYYILLGDMYLNDNIIKKRLYKLKLFYQQIKKEDINCYTNIDLRYENQIIAKKRQL